SPVSPMSRFSRVPCACTLICIATLTAHPAAGEEIPRTGELRWEKHVLVKNLNEGCAIADVNNDGKLDVIAGSAWYEGPLWTPRPIRELKPTGPNNEFF